MMDSFSSELAHMRASLQNLQAEVDRRAASLTGQDVPSAPEDTLSVAASDTLFQEGVADRDLPPSESGSRTSTSSQGSGDGPVVSAIWTALSRLQQDVPRVQQAASSAFFFFSAQSSCTNLCGSSL